MKDNNVLSDGQRVHPEEVKRLKEELRRVKRENRVMANRLRAHDRSKAEIPAKMGRMAAVVRQIGRVRIVDVNTVDAEQQGQYLGLVQCAALCRTNYVTMTKRLQAEGIIVREGNVWVVSSDYQQSGLFVYLSGVRGNYTRFYLKVTPDGVPFIQQVLARHPHVDRSAKCNTTE